MSESNSNLDEGIRKIVSEYYTGNERPLLLATLGSELQHKHYTVPGDKPGNLKRYIIENLSSEFAIVSHETVLSRVAICPNERRQQVFQTLNDFVSPKQNDFSKPVRTTSGESNALLRLIAAQPLDLRERFVIPSDIAEILMRRP
ncbi:MAG: hypothetical protein WCF85_02980 [Rhodospirillaceae bacterium]